MKIAIRMDDITPDMDWKRFLEMKALLDEYGIKPLLGVVPDNQDPKLHKSEVKDDFWGYLVQLQKEGYILAMHGFQHVYTTKKAGLFPLNHNSEFAGLCYEQQKDMLKKGTEILRSHGITTDIFMAPSHSYDKNTLRALKELGYQKITDGFGTKPYNRYGLTFYPISFILGHSLKKKSGYTTMVVHTNMLSENDFIRYCQIFCEQRENLISFDEYIQVKPVKCHIWKAFSEYILAVSKYTLVKLRGAK